MNYRNRFSVARWLAPMLILLLAACTSSAEPPIPTREPAPTFTPTTQIQAPGSDVDPAVAAAAATAAADAAATQAAQAAPPEQPTTAPEQVEPPTPEPTATVVQAAEVVINSPMNVRGGPGTNYNVIGAANQGDRYPVTGKNNDGSWWQIGFNGQQGWVFADLVTAQNVQAVAIAPNIPAPPPTAIPQPTAVPQPTNPPEAPPQEQPTAAPPPASDNFPFILGETERCDPNAGNTYFNGFVRDSNNNPMNGVCVHIAFYEPRGTKCSGCDGVGDGNWGFSPFGGPAKGGEPIEIFVVACDGPMPEGGQTAQSGFGDLTPQSPKWTHTVNGSEQCTGITFYKK